MSSQLYTQSSEQQPSSSSSSSHKRNASSYISAENGGPSSSSTTATTIDSISTSGGGGYSLTQRSPSPSPTKATFDDVGGPLGSTSLARSMSTELGLGSGPGGFANLTPQRIGRAIAARFMRAARRGNLPFLFVFFSCTLVFFSALAGIGYHEPPTDLDPSLNVPGGDGSSGAMAGGFKFGGPVFDLTDAQLKERRIAEQRALEESWARMRRPKDGAWMRKQRDDKAIRRKKPTSHPTTTTTAEETYETVVAEMADTGDDASEGLAAPPS